jgi:hypothetical protein
MNCMIHTCVLYKYMALNWVLQKNLLGIKSNNCFFTQYSWAIWLSHVHEVYFLFSHSTQNLDHTFDI